MKEGRASGPQGHSSLQKQRENGFTTHTICWAGGQKVAWLTAVKDKDGQHDAAPVAPPAAHVWAFWGASLQETLRLYLEEPFGDVNQLQRIKVQEIKRCDWWNQAFLFFWHWHKDRQGRCTAFVVFNRCIVRQKQSHSLMEQAAFCTLLSSFPQKDHFSLLAVEEMKVMAENPNRPESNLSNPEAHPQLWDTD